jgi:hypothetical protein
MSGLHKTKNCGLRCRFCGGLGHIKERCLKKEDPKLSDAAMNYLEVVVDDEEVIRN